MSATSKVARELDILDDMRTEVHERVELVALKAVSAAIGRRDPFSFGFATGVALAERAASEQNARRREL